MSYSIDDFMEDLEEIERLTGKRLITHCSHCGKENPDAPYSVWIPDEAGNLGIYSYHSRPVACAEEPGGQREMDGVNSIIFNSTKPKALARKMLRYFLELYGRGTMALSTEGETYKHLKFWAVLPERAQILLEPWEFQKTKSRHPIDQLADKWRERSEDSRKDLIAP